MKNPDLINLDIPTKVKGEQLDREHQGSPGLKTNYNKQIGIPHLQDQPCGAHYPTKPLLPHETAPFAKNWGEMGTTASLYISSTGTPYLDQIHTVVHLSRITNSQHNIYLSDSNTMVRHIRVWHRRLQQPRSIMDLLHISKIPWNIHVQHNIIIGVRNINLPHHPKNRTIDAHYSLHI